MNKTPERYVSPCTPPDIASFTQRSIKVVTEIKREDLLKLLDTTLGNSKILTKYAPFWKTAKTMQTLWGAFGQHPYPTADEIMRLKRKTGLKFPEICSWFEEKRAEIGISWDKETISRRRNRVGSNIYM